VAPVGPLPLDAATFATSAAFLALLPRLPPPAQPGQAALAGGPARRAGGRPPPLALDVDRVRRCAEPARYLPVSWSWGPVIAQQELGRRRRLERDRLRIRRWQHRRQRARAALAPRPPLRTAFLGALALTPFLYLTRGCRTPPGVIVTASTCRDTAAVFNVLHNTTLQTHVPSHLVFPGSLRSTCSALSPAVPLGLGLAGPLAQATSPRTVLTAAAVLAILGTITILCIRRRPQPSRTHLSPGPHNRPQPQALAAQIESRSRTLSGATDRRSRPPLSSRIPIGSAARERRSHQVTRPRDARTGSRLPEARFTGQRGSQM